MQGGMTLSDIPAAIIAAIGPVLRLSDSSQGMTSTVVIAETADGKAVIKRAEGTLYGGWLVNEYRVLNALGSNSETHQGLAPVPRAFARVDTGIVPERWLAMDYIPGVTLETALRGCEDSALRGRLLHSYGQTLARLHATPPPQGIPRPTPTWLDFMLEEAGENLEHFIVDGTPQHLEKLRRTRLPQSVQTLIHGDYSIDNVIVANEHVNGVIDWSGGAVGDPRYDLALATRPQHVAFEADRRHDLEAFYAGYGSEPVSADVYDYFIGLYEFF